METKIDLPENIKLTVSLLSAVLIFIGIVGAEVYYATFGIQYQSMGLPVVHLTYRGVTASFNSGYLWIAYAIATTLLLYPSTYFNFIKKWTNTTIAYLSILLISISILVLAYFGTKHSARITALSDLVDSSSNLSVLKDIQLNKKVGNKVSTQYAGLRVLALGTEYLILIKSIDDPKYERSNTFFIRREDIHEFTITRH